MLPQTDEKFPELADYCQKILKDFEAGALSQKEFDKEICYTSLKYGFDELAYVPHPQPPMSIVAYRGMDYLKKKAFLRDTDWFFREGEAADYMKITEKIDNMNYRNHNWLLYMAETLKDDAKSLSLIQDKLYAHQDKGEQHGK